MLERLRGDIAADLAEYGVNGVRRVLVIVWRLLFVHRTQAVVLLRLAQTLGNVSPPAAVAVKWLNGTVTGCDISWKAQIGTGFQIYHPGGVVIGPNVVIGNHCTVMQNVTVGHDRGGSPVLADSVMIGPGACVLGPVFIGPGARVGANSVVTKSIPAGSIAFGNPASIRQRDPEDATNEAPET